MPRGIAAYYTITRAWGSTPEGVFHSQFAWSSSGPSAKRGVMPRMRQCKHQPAGPPEASLSTYQTMPEAFSRLLGQLRPSANLPLMHGPPRHDALPISSFGTLALACRLLALATTARTEVLGWSCKWCSGLELGQELGLGLGLQD